MLQLIKSNSNLNFKAKIESLKNPIIKVIGIELDISNESSEYIIEDFKTRNELNDEHFVKFLYKYKTPKNVQSIGPEVNGAAHSKIMVWNCNGIQNKKAQIEKLQANIIYYVQGEKIRKFSRISRTKGI